MNDGPQVDAGPDEQTTEPLPGMPITLAIECSQRQASVAVLDGAGHTHVQPLKKGDRCSDDMHIAIAELCEREGVRPADLQLVAVSVGPGGFSGLRVATAAAKMIALTTGASVVAVPSALVAAHVRANEHIANWSDIHVLVVALACKGDSAWLTQLQRFDDDARDELRLRWRIIGEPALATSLPDKPESIVLLADDHLPANLRAQAGQRSMTIAPLHVDAQAAMQVGIAMHRNGDTTDRQLLSPLYPREPEAVRLWRSRAGQ